MTLLRFFAWLPVKCPLIGWIWLKPYYVWCEYTRLYGDHQIWAAARGYWRDPETGKALRWDPYP